MRHDPNAVALNAELLARLGAFAEPVTLARVFDGIVPSWALPAVDRLLIAGLVRELPDGRIQIVAAR